MINTNIIIVIVQVIFLVFNTNGIKTPVPRSEIDPRISGGDVTHMESAPWQVSVRLKEYEQYRFGSGHICGGSLISQRVIVTAAHCIVNEDFGLNTFRSASEFTVVMGNHLLYSTFNTLQYDVLQIIVNADFNIKTLVNDVALFFLNGKIPSNSPTTAPIPLSIAMQLDGTVCNITGWGAAYQDSNVNQNMLLGLDVPIVDSITCDKFYGNISLGMLCAGDVESRNTTCTTDLGGPLVCGGVLAGIISWGGRCAIPGYPGVYTNVSYYNNWIVTQNKSLDYSYYNKAADRNMKKFVSLILPIVIFVLK